MTTIVQLAVLPPGPYYVDRRGDGVWMIRVGPERHLAACRYQAEAECITAVLNHYPAVIAELEALRARLPALEAAAGYEDTPSSERDPFDGMTSGSSALFD